MKSWCFRNVLRNRNLTINAFKALYKLCQLIPSKNFIFSFFLPKQQLNHNRKLIAILRHIDGIGRKYIPHVHHIITSKNFSFDLHKLSLVLLSFCPTTVELLYKSNCNFGKAKLIILMVLEENMFCVLGSVTLRLCPIRNIFSSS